MEMHVQLHKRPAPPYPETDCVTQLKSKSVKFEKNFREFIAAQPDSDWRPITVGVVCPQLLNATLKRVQDFVEWLEGLVDGSPSWVCDSAVMRIVELSREYCADVANGVYGQSFSSLTYRSGKYKIVAPVIFITYRRKDIRDL